MPFLQVVVVCVCDNLGLKILAVEVVSQYKNRVCPH